MYLLPRGRLNYGTESDESIMVKIQPGICGGQISKKK